MTSPARGVAGVLLLLGVGPMASASHQDFSKWLEGFVREAREQGISEVTIDAAFDGVEPLSAILELDRGQPRKPAGFCGYLDRRLTTTRIARGKRVLREHRDLLSRVSAEYGVPPRFIVALWGLETNFGDYLGDYRVIDALATLAHDDRRGPLFRTQLFAALRIVEQGHQTPGGLLGSWAGAMGQVQLMPTTFLRYAVDYDGDGRKDVWKSLPDSFATAASYLNRSGWRTGQTWGREVRISRELGRDPSQLKVPRSLAEWQRAGVRRIAGEDLPDAEMKGTIVLPDRTPRYAFLVYPNFYAILRWNESTFFGISVGALADEISSTASLRACRGAS